MGGLLGELESQLGRITTREVSFEDRELFMHVLLDEATRLPVPNGKTLPCPYMVIEGGRSQVRSTVQEKSKSPLWNEHLKVEIASIPCVLKCELRDCVSGAKTGEQDKVLGSFEVVITSEFFNGGGYTHAWHPLQGQQQQGLAETGKVRLAYSFSEQILSQLRAGLHPGKQRTTQLVNETWVIVGKDYKTHSKTFFEKFWEYLPDGKNPFKDAGHADLDAPFMQAHSIQVLKTVGQFMINPTIADDLQRLLTSLGNLHAGMGIEDVHFLAMEAALLDTLESALGARWDREVRAAWTDSFVRLHQIMLPTFRGTSVLSPPAMDKVTELPASAPALPVV